MSDNKKKMKKAAGYTKPVMTQEENDLMMNRLMLSADRLFLKATEEDLMNLPVLLMHLTSSIIR